MTRGYQSRGELERIADQGEAFRRLDSLLAKRGKLATENFVRAIIELGLEQGFDLTQGDRCFIHPDDVPESVNLEGGPVIPSKAIAIVRGQMYFVKSKQLDKALNAPPILTPKTGTQ